MSYEETIEYILENIKGLDLNLMDKERNIEELEKLKRVAS